MKIFLPGATNIRFGLDRRHEGEPPITEESRILLNICRILNAREENSDDDKTIDDMSSSEISNDESDLINDCIHGHSRPLQDRAHAAATAFLNKRVQHKEILIDDALDGDGNLAAALFYFNQ